MGSFEKVSLEEKNAVRTFFNVTENDVKRDVEILMNWYRQQRHLPQNVLDHDFMEKMLLRSKFRVEHTKRKVDSYFTVKGLFRKFYENNTNIIPSKQLSIDVSLEYMTDKQQRIHITKMVPKDNDPDAFLNGLRSVFLELELDLMYNYSTEIIAIMDLDGFSLQSYLKLNLMLLVEYTKVFQAIFAGRVQAMHFINASGIFNLALNLIKPVTNVKFQNRLHVHDNLESLHRVIPKKYLPSDYGGEQKSFKEHLDLLDQSFKDHTARIETHINRFADESLRLPDNPYKNQYFGTDGTFKKIEID